MTRTMRSMLLSTIEPEAWARGLERVLALAGVGLLGFLLFHLLLFRYGCDQAWCAMVGDGLLHGEMPYRDRWCLRPPGIYLFYAAGQVLFGKNMLAIRIVEVGALLSLFVALPLFSRRHLGSTAPGFAGALLATLAQLKLGYWETSQSESFGGVVLVWALLLVTWRPASRRRQLAAWLAASGLMTFAAMLKPHMGGSFVLCLALLVRERYRAAGGSRQARFGPGGILEPILAFGAGGTIVVAATLFPFAVFGGFADLLWTFGEVLPGYVAVAPRSEHDLLPGIWKATRMLFRFFSPYFLPGLVLWALLPPLGRRDREGALYLAAAIVPQLLGVALQAKFFLYHSAGMLHLVALWSAWGFFKVWQRVRHRPLWALLMLTAVIALGVNEPHQFWDRCGARWEAFLNSDRRAEIEDRLYSKSGHYHAEILETAQWLRSNTPPEAGVFVWGPQAAIYFHSDRRPASRFIGSGALRSSWGAAQTRRILEQELALALPAAIVVSHGDREPWVTGHSLDSAESLRHYPWLSRLLETRYEETVRFGRLQVYRLR